MYLTNFNNRIWGSIKTNLGILNLFMKILILGLRGPKKQGPRNVKIWDLTFSSQTPPNIMGPTSEKNQFQHDYFTELHNRLHY